MILGAAYTSPLHAYGGERHLLAWENTGYHASVYV